MRGNELMEKSLEVLAELTQTKLVGDGDLVIKGVNALDSATGDQLSFLANRKYDAQLATSRAGAVIIPADVKTSKPALISKNPYADFVKILTLFAPPVPVPEVGIHRSAVVDPSAVIEDDVAIGPLCVVAANVVIGKGSKLVAQIYIGHDVKLGEHCLLHPQVVIRENSIIGDRTILQPGVVIGGDGFGFAPHQGRYHKIPQIGNVVLEDDVEIGANTTIDRAALKTTRIGQGSKVDNLVMIAHNVEIGDHTVIAGQTGLSGSTIVGDHVMIAGQVGTAGHLKIGNNVSVGGQSGVTKNIPDGLTVKGYPAKPLHHYMREMAEFGKIADMRKKIKELEKRLEAVEQHDK